MIIIKEKVKDLPTLIFLMIFDFWAGTGWTVLEVWRPLGLNATELSNILQSMILNYLNFSQA